MVPGASRHPPTAELARALTHQLWHRRLTTSAATQQQKTTQDGRWTQQVQDSDGGLLREVWQPQQLGEPIPGYPDPIHLKQPSCSRCKTQTKRLYGYEWDISDGYTTGAADFSCTAFAAQPTELGFNRQPRALQCDVYSHHSGACQGYEWDVVAISYEEPSAEAEAPVQPRPHSSDGGEKPFASNERHSTRHNAPLPRGDRLAGS